MVKKLLVTFFVMFAFTANVFSLESEEKGLSEDPKDKTLESKWSLNVVYTEHGFGLSTTLFKPLSKKTDFFASILIAGISDDKEYEKTGMFSDNIIEGKENRLISIPLSFGIQHKLFSGSLEGKSSFIPTVSAGIAPAVILSTPYDKDFFSSLGYANAKFAIGPFAGVGMKFRQGASMSFDLDLRYYYLPVIGGEVNSMKDKLIKNVGGLQLVFGLNFMK